jgi:hypothetical protein
MKFSYSQPVIRGIGRLSYFLQLNRNKLVSQHSSPPIVLVHGNRDHDCHAAAPESDPEAAAAASLKDEWDAVQRVDRMLQHDHKLPVIKFPVSDHDHWNAAQFCVPSVESIEALSDLILRYRSSTIVALGCDSAVEAAKAVASSHAVDDRRPTIRHLLAVPASYRACVVAGAARSVCVHHDHGGDLHLLTDEGDNTVTEKTLFALEDAFYTDVDRKSDVAQSACDFIRDRFLFPTSEALRNGSDCDDEDSADVSSMSAVSVERLLRMHHNEFVDFLFGTGELLWQQEKLREPGDQPLSLDADGQHNYLALTGIVQSYQNPHHVLTEGVVQHYQQLAEGGGGGASRAEVAAPKIPSTTDDDSCNHHHHRH